MRELSKMENSIAYGGDPSIGPISATSAGMRAFGVAGAVFTVASVSYDVGTSINNALGLSEALADAAASVFVDPEIETQDSSGKAQ